MTGRLTIGVGAVLLAAALSACGGNSSAVSPSAPVPVNVSQQTANQIESSVDAAQSELDQLDQDFAQDSTAAKGD